MHEDDQLLTEEIRGPCELESVTADSPGDKWVGLVALRPEQEISELSEDQSFCVLPWVLQQEGPLGNMGMASFDLQWGRRAEGSLF